MKKVTLITAAILILMVGVFSTVYAMDGSRYGNTGLRAPMMYQSSNASYKSMIDLMRSNGFEEMAKAMESRDYSAMRAFMSNLTDEQYTQMTNIMNQNGYGRMASMMSSFGRNGMINIHNSMMGRYIK